MTSSVPAAEEVALRDLRESLLRERPQQLGPGEGAEAFRQHQLLAAAIHRATRLYKSKSESETDGWIGYFERYFPDGRNDPADACLLFDDWRTRLLKDGTLGPKVVVAHGQSTVHWSRDVDDRLGVNLEDMWDDFVTSVDRFIAHLRANTDRRRVVLKRAKDRSWTINPFIPRDLGASVGATVFDSSAAPSVSAAPPPKR